MNREMLVIWVLTLCFQWYLLFKQHPYVPTRSGITFDPRPYWVTVRLVYGVIVCLFSVIPAISLYFNIDYPEPMCSHHNEQCFFHNIGIVIQWVLYASPIMYSLTTLLIAHWMRCLELELNSRCVEINPTYIKYTSNYYWLCFSSSHTVTVPISKINQVSYTSGCIDVVFGASTVLIDTSATIGPASTPDLIITEVKDASTLCANINAMIDCHRKYD